MSIAPDVRHGQAPDENVERQAQELRDALAALPTERQDAVLTELANVATTYEIDGRVDPVLHFVRSLKMTARLHRNPAYRKSVEEAAEQPVGEGAEIIDVDTFMQRMHERHGKG